MKIGTALGVPVVLMSVALAFVADGDLAIGAAALLAASGGLLMVWAAGDRP